MKSVTIQVGEAWAEISGGKVIPDHQISKIVTFLGSAFQDDLVYTEYDGDLLGHVSREGVVLERLVLVGATGAGRRIRQSGLFDSAQLLSSDVDAIYLCESQTDSDCVVRYVLFDIRGSSDGFGAKATLLFREGDLAWVQKYLYGESSGGKVWRGPVADSGESIRSIDESKFCFDESLLNGLRSEVVGFLKGDVARRLRKWGERPKRTVLLHGSPGNGKTVLGRICAKWALADEMNVVIIHGKRRSSRSFDRHSMGLGDELRRGASRAPALLVFEDIDLHCGRRPLESGLGDDQEQQLAEILDFLDGVDAVDGFVLLASTNFPDRLDPALRRSGRIDREIEVPKPSAAQRVKALGQMIERGPSPAPDVSAAAESLRSASFADLAEVASRYKIFAANAPTADTGELLSRAASEFAREIGDASEGEARRAG